MLFAWLLLMELLLLQLAELLAGLLLLLAAAVTSVRAGLQLLPVWMLGLLLLSLLSLLPLEPPSGFSRPWLRALAGRVMPCVRTHEDWYWRSRCVSHFCAFQKAPVTSHSWYCTRMCTAARTAGNGTVSAPILCVYPAESSGMRRPSHTAASALPIHLLSSAFPAAQLT